MPYSMPLAEGDALIVIDIQNDFLPGGALGVPGGDATVAVLNRWIDAAQRADVPVVFSRDWHPPGHASFQAQGGRWPEHCVRDTPGAAFHPALCIPEGARIVSKATDPDRDAYSAFDGTGLAGWLAERDVRRVWIGGLTLDYCAKFSALDARQAGLDVHLIADATLPVNLQPGDGHRALAEMLDAGVVIHRPPDPASGLALLTDLYELTMVQAYDAARMHQPATFELFFRELPASRNFAVAAGLDDVLDYLESLQFTDDDLAYLSAQERFSDAFLDRLAGFRFTGEVRAMPEGSVCFPNEPLVQVTAPLPEAQLVETMLINQMHLQTVVASKAARVTLAAEGRTAVDFGSRRAHGTDAALKTARCCYLAGLAGTSNVAAGRRFGIPIFGTMAHSYVQAYDDELQAWEHFAQLYPHTTLLVDTFDTLAGVRNVVRLRERLGEAFNVRAVRLDSGDLADLARRSRAILDDAGLGDVKVFASGGLDERKLAKLIADGAPIDGFGVGTKLVVAEDVPTLDFAYKLVEYDGRPRTKLSSDKVIYPGRKQVFRRTESARGPGATGEGSATRGRQQHSSDAPRPGRMIGDVIAHADERLPGEPLLRPVMRDGHRLPEANVTLAEVREYAQAQLAALPDAIRALDPAGEPYPVAVSDRLTTMLAELKSRSAASPERTD